VEPVIATGSLAEDIWLGLKISKLAVD